MMFGSIAQKKKIMFFWPPKEIEALACEIHNDPTRLANINMCFDCGMHVRP